MENVKIAGIKSLVYGNKRRAMTKHFQTVIIFIMLFLCMIFIIHCSSKAVQKPNNKETAQAKEDIVKDPNVAGQFYPSSAKELSSSVESFLKKANPPESKDVLTALISPHAGYIYSGPVAAYGYKLLLYCKYSTVIIIAPTHHLDFEGFAIYKEGSFRTPLGTVPIDKDTAARLVTESPLIKSDEKPFYYEHSLEVQIPFLQKTLKDFKIVPIIAGKGDLPSCRELARAIKKVFSPGETLLIASSDMSHYHSGDNAEKIDKKTISFIEKPDEEGLFTQLRSGKCELCGAIPVVTTMILAKDLTWKPVVLKYAHSGDITGDNSRVVGYSSIAWYTKKQKVVDKVESNEFLTKEEKKLLLTMARQTLEEYLKTGNVPEFFKDIPIPEHLKQETGMFVTLHKDHMLRGCIGYITGREPLHKAVVDLAISSATRDPRFRPVKYEELKDIHIEISVMTPLKRIYDPNEVIVGKHGVVVQKGMASGVFLPQVATEQGWNKETFLTELCKGKAGLPGDAWKNKDTELYIFSADVFGEEK